MELMDPNIMDATTFFNSPTHSTHKRYEALRALHIEKLPAEEVAKRFNYSITTVYSLSRDFKKQLNSKQEMGEQFFNTPVPGRKVSDNHDQLREKIILLRKKYLSVPDIKTMLDALGLSFSERQIYKILSDEGFARLPRRNAIEKQTALPKTIIKAPKSEKLNNETIETFSTNNAGLFLFFPYIVLFKLDQVIQDSPYPGTKQIPVFNAILSFLGLKLSNIRRYSSDDLWCMDRGIGLFAGLNVLPKAGWYTSYSSRITHKMNLTFLKSLHALWLEHGLLSDTANLDFVTLPYWGEDHHLENNWSGTRHHALRSMVAVLAQDPDSGIITYGDTSIKHKNEANVAVEFLDFYKHSDKGNTLKYLVFDSKFTTYENLRKLDDNEVKFITIRRRGKKIVESLEQLSDDDWKKIRVPTTKAKTRLLKVHESTIKIKLYGKELRQIAITGHGKIKPALIITNDFDKNLSDIIRKYARRWLIEKTIAEQTHFFHLNRLSSSMVIKVDFDLVMTILAHNLYRLLAMDLPGFEKSTAQVLYDKLIHNEGTVDIEHKRITVKCTKA